MLQGLVDFDGYYLESDLCLVCNNAEVPYTGTYNSYICFSMLQGLVDFDGYYLESDLCLVCNNPEVPYTGTYNSYICFSMLQGLVDFDGYYLESDPCLVCNNPEVPYTVSWLVPYIENLTESSCIIEFVKPVEESILNKSENATLQLSIFCEKVLDKKYLLKLNNVSQTSSKRFVHQFVLFDVWVMLL